MRLCFSLLLASSALAIAQVEPQLGEAPRAPTDLAGLPKTPPSMQLLSGDFTVDTQSREEVRSFFNAVYEIDENVQMGSTADVTTCTPGTNAPGLYEAVLRRINWFRAMAGIPANVGLNPTLCPKNQAAALMMSANDELNHFPPVSWTCFSGPGANAASNSNIALGVSGPAAITGYMLDHGGNNAPVGHRRWLLYPQTKLMGTGDIPRQGTFKPANAVWVFDDNYSNPRPATRDGFVSWPPPGYVPAPTVYPRWSFAYPKADFSSAVVTMTSNNVPIAIRQENLSIGFGENTLVWVPLGLDANNYLTTWPFSGADTTYKVTISNISGAPKNSYSYSVTVFDPLVPGADFTPTTISGPAQLTPGVAGNYTLSTTANATGYEWASSLVTPFTLSDGAEGTPTNFVADISEGYKYVTNLFAATGSQAYHLAMPVPDDQFLTLTSQFIPRSNGSLQFDSTLGAATSSQIAHVQASTNGGSSWFDLYKQPGIGGWGETSYTHRAIPLSSLAGLATSLRFFYEFVDGPNDYYTDIDSGVPGAYFGWYIDNIKIQNIDLMSNTQVHPASGNTFSFATAQPGNYVLQGRALIFSDFPLAWGSPKPVTISGSSGASVELDSPIVASGKVTLNFQVTGSAASFQLEHAGSPTGPWNVDSGAVLTTVTAGTSYRFSTSPSGNTQYYRVAVH